MKLERVIAGIEPFAKARVVEKLAGGPSSDSYLLERDAERFVLRIDTDIAAALGLDRVTETAILTFVSRAGIGPAPEYTDVEEGIMVTRYVEGRAWTEKDLQDRNRIQNLAALLRQLHALEPQGRVFDIVEKVDCYARTINTADGHKLADGTRQLLRELNDPLAPQCLCHNDLSSANIIEGRGLTFIDWEYAAIGDPMFDLATIAEHHHFDKLRTKTLLDAYFDTACKDDIDRLHRYRFLYRNLLVLWLASIERLCGISAEQQNRLQQEWAILKTSGSL